MKELKDLERMDYFLWHDSLYRVIEFEGDNDIRYIHCQHVLFKMDGYWHESTRSGTERFNPYCTVQLAKIDVTPLEA